MTGSDHSRRFKRELGMQFVGHSEAEHPGGLMIDDELELARLHDRQVRGFAIPKWEIKGSVESLSLSPGRLPASA
jgi:hypothetical protein